MMIDTSNDSLVRHIAKNNIGLKQRPAIPGDGNCWYNSCFDLIKHFDVEGPSDSFQLRLAVSNRMMQHPTDSGLGLYLLARIEHITSLLKTKADQIFWLITLE